MVLNRSLLVAAALGVCGCLNKVPAQRLDSRTPIAVAYLAEGLETVPEAFRSKLETMLDQRNLAAREVTAGQVAVQRLTAERFEALKAAAGDAPLLLLVEARAQFFTQIQGRFRWTVALKVTAARAGGAPSQDSSDLPALLQFEHERASEALENVADFAAARVAPLIDGLLVGLGSPDAGAERAQRALGDAVYFVMVDRFANGDPRNDGPSVDPRSVAAFHGGDLRGLIQRLDWLFSLRVGTVWLSPIFLARSEPFDGHPAFHGYWVDRLDEVDPRWGSEQELVELRRALSERGIKLVLDLVLNHVGPQTSLTRAHPEWFHGRGGIRDWKDRQQLWFHDVQGLPDLADERDDVFAYLVESSLKWVRLLKPDGFRLDAVKHMGPRFWARFNRAVSGESGPAFMLLGEMLDGDPSEVARAWREGGFTAMFDFPLRFAMIDVMCHGASPARLAAVLTDDRQYPDPMALVTLLDNHDLPRLASECQERAPEALKLLYLMRGTPSITWGTEAGLKGEREPDNRPSMVFDTGAPLKAVMEQAAKQRAEHPALRLGVPAVVALSEGVLVLERISPQEIATIRVGSGRVEVSFTEGEFEERYRAARSQWLTGKRTRRVEFDGPNGAWVVGSGPELGAWNVERALRLPAAAQLPVGGAFELKLVSESKAWEDGPNRILFVSDGAAPLRVQLSGRGS